MHRHSEPERSEAESLSALAYALGNFAQTDGDYTTGIPALTLHRRSAPTEPLHCIYSLGLGVIAQGAKQVMLVDEVIKSRKEVKLLDGATSASGDRAAAVAEAALPRKVQE